MGKAKYSQKLPKDLNNLALDIQEIIINSKRTKPIIPTVIEEDGVPGWDIPSLQKKSLPDDVEEWSSKHFVHWFVTRRKLKNATPYVIEYSRDCSAIKKLKESLSGIGKNKAQDLKDFLLWTFDKYHRILEQSKAFNLIVLSDYLNDYLNEKFNEAEDVEAVEVDILSQMKERYSNSKSKHLSVLLEVFGIPLTASFYRKFGKSEEIIRKNIEDKLVYLVDINIILLKDIFRKSIDMSPYPHGFLLTTWREVFEDIIDNIDIQKERWWRDVDYSGENENYKNLLID